MKLPFGLLLLLLIVAAAGARGADADHKDSGALAKQVHEIFEAKCVDCHGPELPRPKGKFGYVLDLKRIAANPDYIMPGQPEKSDLYKMVEDDEMPGEDANVPPLTPEEKAAVKRWIEAGAPSDLPTKKEPEVAAATAPVKQEPLWRHLLRWSGQFHPVTTHFPVALMFVAAFAEALGWALRKESWKETVRFLVIIAALGAVAAATSGWINASFSSYNKAPWALLWWHRWLGTATAVWAVVTAGASLTSHGRPGSKDRAHFRVALLLGALLVGIVGFLGSALIYGLDHYAWR